MIRIDLHQFHRHADGQTNSSLYSITTDRASHGKN